MNGSTASLENARDFLFQKNIIKSSMSCPGCNQSIFLTPCSSSKSPYGLIWRCYPCKKYKNIRQSPLWTEAHTRELCTTPLLFEYKRTSLGVVHILRHQYFGNFVPPPPPPPPPHINNHNRDTTPPPPPPFIKTL